MRFLLAIALLVSLAACTSNPRADTRVYNTDFSDPRLEQMLAPVALYPDTVLSHILIAATYPLEIVQAHRWSLANNHPEGEAAVNAANGQEWDPSVRALVAFPDILERMSNDLAWTQEVGDAFLEDESAVMDTIQHLRQKAWASGSLDKLPHVTVQREQEVIVIEPRVERVVYIPTYDTRVVYGNWWWPDYPPVYWHYPHHTSISSFYWGGGIHIGSGFYFSSFHWPRRQVVYVDYHRHQHRPHFHSGRAIVQYQGARHWRHNPVHRRGVAYRHHDTARQFNSNRPTTHERYQQRFERGNLSSTERAQRPNTRVYRQNQTGADVDRQRPSRPESQVRNQRPQDADRVRQRLQQQRSEARQSPRPGRERPAEATRRNESRPAQPSPPPRERPSASPDRRQLSTGRDNAAPRPAARQQPHTPARQQAPAPERRQLSSGRDSQQARETPRGNGQQRTFSNGGSGHRAAPANTSQRTSNIHRPARESRSRQ